MLLSRIEKHLRLTGMTPTRFGRESLSDPSLVFNLRSGREPRASTVQRILIFLEIREARDGQ